MAAKRKCFHHGRLRTSTTATTTTKVKLAITFRIQVGQVVMQFSDPCRQDSDEQRRGARKLAAIRLQIEGKLTRRIDVPGKGSHANDPTAVGGVMSPLPREKRCGGRSGPRCPAGIM